MTTTLIDADGLSTIAAAEAQAALAAGDTLRAREKYAEAAARLEQDASRAQGQEDEHLARFRHRLHPRRRVDQVSGNHPFALGADGDSGLTGPEELLELPTAPAARWVGEDRPERVDGRQVLPLSLLPSYHVRAGFQRYTRREPGTRSRRRQTESHSASLTCAGCTFWR